MPLNPFPAPRTLSQPLPKFTEEELVALLQARSEAGFSYLYDNYAAALYGLLLQMTGQPEAAADLLQEVFVKIWNHIDRYDATIARLYTWMIQITRNTALDYLKSKNYKKSQQNQPLSDAVSEKAPLNSLAATDYIGLAKVLEQLDGDKKQLIDLAYYKGYTQDEISQCLGIPLGTVKTRLRAAFVILRKLLKDYR